MSIAPPSDIILDVAQAAEPARRQAAVSKLAQAAAQGGVAFASTDFEAALSGAAPVSGVADTTAHMSPLVGAGRSQVTAGHGSVYQKFEAMVLQNFVENILPKDNDLYGDAASADMCRSMMAGKLAEQLAKSGRIGIAKSIERFETKVAANAAAGPSPASAPSPATGQTSSPSPAMPVPSPGPAIAPMPVMPALTPLKLKQG